MDNFVGNYQPLPQRHNSFLAELLHTVWEPEGRSANGNEKSARQSDFQLQETHTHTYTHTVVTEELLKNKLEIIHTTWLNFL